MWWPSIGATWTNVPQRQMSTWTNVYPVYLNILSRTIVGAQLHSPKFTVELMTAGEVSPPSYVPPHHHGQGENSRAGGLPGVVGGGGEGLVGRGQGNTTQL